MTDHFERTGEDSNAATAAELLDPTTTRVDVKELLEVVLSLESPRGLLDFFETRGKVTLAVTHDGVELTGSTSVCGAGVCHTPEPLEAAGFSSRRRPNLGRNPQRKSGGDAVGCTRHWSVRCQHDGVAVPAA